MDSLSTVNGDSHAFRALVDMIPQIAWTALPDGYHDFLNARWYEYTGLSPVDRGPTEPGAEVTRAIHPDDVTLQQARWRESVAHGQPYSVEYRLRREDGEYRWFIARAIPLCDDRGRVTRWYGTITDIHDQKEAHASDRQALASAEKQTRMKDEFVATLSHELRTPLSAILGWVQILRKHEDEPETISQGLEVIERNAQVQAQMVDDLLDMSRIVSGKLRLEVQRVDPAVVVQAAVDTVQLSARAKGVRLQTSLQSAGMVEGDPDRLQQIFWNLLSNAIKFTPAGGLISVSLLSKQGEVEVSISDTGAGMSADFLPHVFDRFRQEGTTVRRHSGLGLGLSIVRSLVELHSGRIAAYSHGENRGSTFVVHLPVISGALPKADKVVKALPDALKGVAVLVIDDQPDGLELTRRILADAGAEVSVANSGREAVALLETSRPAVIVSDISMPEMDGYELIRRLKAMPHGAAVPAAALTALARSEDRRRALSAGFQVHISKPVDASELVAAVASLAVQANDV
jgi:PAS domain S-box-containing protein